MTTGADNEGSLTDQVATNPATKSTPSQVVTALQHEHPDWISEIVQAHGEVTAIVPGLHIVDVCSHLKSAAETNFNG